MKDCILFGAGTYGKLAFEQLTRGGCNIVRYSDNNSELWGTQINGVTIIPPCELKNYDVQVIVCTRLYQECVEQLINLGIKKVLVARPETGTVAEWDPIEGLLQDYESDFYDTNYIMNKAYSMHYTKSVYYNGWKEAISFLEKKDYSILEIGCGSGQFASMLFANGFKKYIGLDFSTEGVNIAKKVNSEHAECFFVANALDTEIVTKKWDVVICFEVLEHIQEDLEVLGRIQAGTKCLLSVPNYDSAYHVRYFETVDKVKNRYKKVINIHEIKTVFLNENNCLYYIYGEKI